MAIAPAAALSDKAKSGREQMTSPGLKVAARTRILSRGNLDFFVQK